MHTLARLEDMVEAEVMKDIQDILITSRNTSLPTTLMEPGLGDILFPGRDSLYLLLALPFLLLLLVGCLLPHLLPCHRELREHREQRERQATYGTTDTENQPLLAASTSNS